AGSELHADAAYPTSLRIPGYSCPASRTGEERSARALARGLCGGLRMPAPRLVVGRWLADGGQDAFRGARRRLEVVEDSVDRDERAHAQRTPRRAARARTCSSGAGTASPTTIRSQLRRPQTQPASKAQAAPSPASWTAPSDTPRGVDSRSASSSTKQPAAAKSPPARQSAKRRPSREEPYRPRLTTAAAPLSAAARATTATAAARRNDSPSSARSSISATPASTAGTSVSPRSFHRLPIAISHPMKPP